MKILGIDTSGGTCCAALLEDEVVLAELNINYNKTHSQVLMPMIEVIRQMTELSLETLDAIAVAAGPGSFTGLRIGSASAKGLGLALDIPIVPVPTLEALAYRAYGFGGLVCPIMDARRSQVYCGVYEFCAEGEDHIDTVMDAEGERERDFGENAMSMREIVPGAALPLSELTEVLNGLSRQVMFVGDGIPVYREALREQLRVPYFLAPPHMRLQGGAAVAARGRELYLAGKAQPAADHKPFYFRKPQAEREREEKSNETSD